MYVYVCALPAELLRHIPPFPLTVAPSFCSLCLLPPSLSLFLPSSLPHSLPPLLPHPLSFPLPTSPPLLPSLSPPPPSPRRESGEGQLTLREGDDLLQRESSPATSAVSLRVGCQGASLSLTNPMISVAMRGKVRAFSHCRHFHWKCTVHAYCGWCVWQIYCTFHTRLSTHTQLLCH